jgi:hypothetical protein
LSPYSLFSERQHNHSRRRQRLPRQRHRPQQRSRVPEFLSDLRERVRCESCGGGAFDWGVGCELGGELVFG